MKKCVVLCVGRVNCPVPTVWALSARSKISFYRAHVRAGFLLESAREALQILQVATQAKALTHTKRERERERET